MQAEAGSFVEAIPLPALIIRGDDRIEAANGLAKNLLGQGIAGRHFITALRAPTLLDAIENSLRDGQPRSCDFLTTEGQQDVTYKVSVRAVSPQSQRALLVCFEDVTHLAQAGTMRRDFVANVSHELRTPLTAIMGFVETMQGPARNDPAGQQRFLGIMANEAQRMNRLVGDLLSLSRVESEERMRPTTQIDPIQLIHSTVHGLTLLAQDAGVEIFKDLPDTPFRMIGDEDQLRQVLTNLIENAIKYSGRGAQVTVSLSAPGFDSRLRTEAVTLAVHDTGPGMEPHHIPRLTERFYRVDSHRSREKGGTGLGLAIVKHIVNRHRGRLRINSAPGQGATFAVILPVA